MADVFNIAGEINSTSQEGTAVHANQVKDDLQNKKQSQINEEVGEELELHTNRLNALTGQNYITVQATQSTTAADIPTLINASGEGEQTDTLYRVGFWDGSAYVADKYTEYAWNGTAYVILDVKSSIGEVFDISQYNAVGGTLVTYANLTAALSGTNVPTSVRRGGMSIKFVQSSDNNYVQYRYIGTAVTGSPNPFLDTANWQGVDVELIQESHNLIEGGVVFKEVDKTNEKIDKIAGSSDKLLDLSVFTPQQGIMRGTEYIGSLGRHINIPVLAGKRYGITGNGAAYNSHYSFVKTGGVTGDQIDFCNGEVLHEVPSQTAIITAPEDAVYLCVNTFVNGTDITPIVYAKGYYGELRALSDEVQEMKEKEPTYAKVDFGVNLFDKNSPNILTDTYFGANGAYTAADGYNVSHPIFVQNGLTYKYGFSSNLGTNKAVMICDSDGDYISILNGTESDGYIEFSVSEPCYVRVNIGRLSVNSFMFTKSSEYPSEYTPFECMLKDVNKLNSGEILDVTRITEEVVDNNDLISSFVRTESKNLFNKFDPLIKNGYYENSAGGRTFIENNNYRVTHPISIKANVSYKALYDSDHFGSNKPYIAVVDKNNNILSFINGTISGNYITITMDYDCYLSFNVGYKTLLDTFMVCKESEYPSSYTPFYDYYEGNDNVVVSQDARLYGKSIIFAGDSICAGAADTQGLAYAGRIGNKNKMSWQNKGVSGGTITNKNVTGSNFTISTTDFGQGADYIILEGGTNDADRIGSILNGNIPANYGSWSESGYGTTFTNQTFCEAVEYLLKHVVSNFPTAKVGFIIAPKMGVSNGTAIATDDYSVEGNNRRAYFETIIKICNKWGVPVLNLWDRCTMNPKILSQCDPSDSEHVEDYFYADGQHPTAKGYDFISPIIEAWIKTL